MILIVRGRVNPNRVDCADTIGSMETSLQPPKRAFAIFTHTFFQGMVPAWYDDETGLPVVYETDVEAQREIAEFMITVLQQFLAGERDFEDASVTGDFVLRVDVHPDGTIS